MEGEEQERLWQVQARVEAGLPPVPFRPADSVILAVKVLGKDTVWD